MAKIANLFHVEHTLRFLGVQRLFLHDAQNLLNMLQMLLPCPVVYKEVIKEQQKLSQPLVEDVIHARLESS
jgi:thiaminase